MKDVAEYLMNNYYTKYHGCLVPPDKDMLLKALDLNKDKVIVIHEGGVIKAVSIYLTLSDETINNFAAFDVSDVNDLMYLLKDEGPHLHFILIVARGTAQILKELKKIKRQKKAKSVSWYNPTMTKLHKYNFN